MTDAEERITWVNDSFEELTGYQAEEAIGQNPGDLLQGPETDPETVQRLSEAIADKKSSQEIILDYSKSGEKYWLDLTIDPIFDEDDNCTGFIAIEKDVTEQIERQRKLKKSVDRYEIVAKATSDTIWDLDLLSDTIEYNMNIYSMFGYKQREVKELGEWWRSKVHPEDQEKVISKIENVLQNRTERFQMEYRFQCADGTYKDIYDRAFIVNDDIGTPIRIIGAMQDVTEQKVEKRWLKLFESAIKTTNESVAIIEAEPTDLPGRKILYVNEAFSKMTGYTKEEVTGETLQILNGPKTSQKKRDQLMRSLEKWETCEVEFVNYTKDGKEFWINVSYAPVKNEDGSFSHWVCVGRDVTNRRQREHDLKESLEEKKILLMEVHHRVKNNLAHCFRYDAATGIFRRK
ncbi:MAG: PAS domain S-box protein [Balneolaceae bacterium]|nr:PAS domain S-box protein [Balneolaceae bacterium]